MKTSHKISAAPDVRILTTSALFAALCCMATTILVVPSPTGGYMNLGDTIVLLGAYLLGPFWGAVAGGFGSALADLMAGYPIYAPATFLIKALMATLAGLLYCALHKTSWSMVVCAALAEAIMVTGYWLYDGLLLGSLAGSAVGIPSNLLQGLFGATASTLLAAAFRKIPYVKDKFPHL